MFAEIVEWAITRLYCDSSHFRAWCETVATMPLYKRRIEKLNKTPNKQMAVKHADGAVAAAIKP